MVQINAILCMFIFIVFLGAVEGDNWFVKLNLIKIFMHSKANISKKMTMQGF